MDFGTSDEPSEAAVDLGCGRAAIDEQGERNRSLKVLIRAAAHGDIAAFETLYNSTAGWLLGRVRRIVGDGHAEDVLAEVFLQVWRSLPVYEETRGEPLAWLATIARSRALDRVRTEVRSHGGRLDAPAGPEVEESHDAGPEQLLAIAERDRLLRISMGALSPKEQLVLGMAYFRDCTQNEIAALTGLPLGSVKTLMTRSQQKLRRSFSAAQLGTGLPHNAFSAPTA
ncbi:MAG: polymerase sigma-e factor sigma-24 [Ramlibacter sp.]|nr:polymerase sigma-e factor sigma-24 [Ramlibacter sp.]